jgi:hypothetical protein
MVFAAGRAEAADDVLAWNANVLNVLALSGQGIPHVRICGGGGG